MRRQLRTLHAALELVPAPLFVVSDLDGTLLDRRERVSPHMREVVGRMAEQGTVFTLATGRPARWVLPVIEQLPVQPLCVCANGAVVYDSAKDEIVRAMELNSATLSTVIQRLTAGAEGTALHGAGFAVERAGTSAFDRADELFCVTEGYDHAWLSDEHKVLSTEDLIAQPAVKLLVRNENVSSQELFDAVAPRLDPREVHATFSWGGGLVEISAPGVSKRTSLEWIAERLGVQATETIAFGDMPNDLEMLGWAGTAVAMGNAHDDVKAAADLVTASNNDDGVAAVLARWF